MEQQQQSKSKQKKTKLFTADTLRLVIFNTTQHHHHRNIAYMEIAWQFFFKLLVCKCEGNSITTTTTTTTIELNKHPTKKKFLSFDILTNKQTNKYNEYKEID